MKGMYGGGMVKAGPKPMGHGGMVDAYRGGGMVMDQYGHGGMVKNKMMMMEKGGQLKPVPKDNPGLGKLPEMVRNRMGYMQEGGMVDDSLMGMRYGGMAKKKKKMMGYQEGGEVGKLAKLLSMITPKGRRQKAYEELVPQDMLPVVEKASTLPDSFFYVAPEESGYIDLEEVERKNAIRRMLQGRPPQPQASQNDLTPFQEGGPIGPPLPPQPMDPLQIGARQADPSMYEGSTLGAIRNQARILQNSIEQDTLNKARNSLKLMSVIDSLKQAGAGESLDYMPMNPMPTSKADSMMLRDLMEYYKMQQMKKMSQ
jgi:hypothetical protein